MGKSGPESGPVGTKSGTTGTESGTGVGTAVFCKCEKHRDNRIL